MIDDERGSILPLVIGYAALAIAIVLVCVNAISLFVAQKRIDALADAAALAASDGFEIVVDGDDVGIRLDHAAARGQAEQVVGAAAVDAALVSVDTTDGSTARATVTTQWEPFLLAAFVPEGVDLAATATSRAALAG